MNKVISNQIKSLQDSMIRSNMIIAVTMVLIVNIKIPVLNSDMALLLLDKLCVALSLITQSINPLVTQYSFDSPLADLIGDWPHHTFSRAFQINYLFTDKTGTLTENDMQFRQCAVGDNKYIEVNDKLCELPTIPGVQPVPLTKLQVHHVIHLDHGSTIAIFEIEALRYEHAQTVFTLSVVINRAEHARFIVIIKHKYMLMCNHKIRINIM